MANEKHALVFVADGSEEIETVGIVDTLVRGGFKVTLASVSPQTQVKCSRGVVLVADCLVGEVDDSHKFDVVALPGGMKGAENIRDSERATTLLKAQRERGGWIAAICASPQRVLEHHGLLVGARATCYPSLELKDESCTHDTSSRVVVDESQHLITSQGPGTTLEFAVAIIDALGESEKAASVKKGLLVHDG